jgi:hypothetical protein
MTLDSLDAFQEGMGEMCKEFLRENLKGRDRKDFGVEGRIFRKPFVNILNEFMWVSTATNGWLV